MARKFGLAAAIVFGLLASTAASASETISYTYDARGRLIKVVHSGTAPSNNVQSCYLYDKADNRTRVKTTTTASPPACPTQ